MSKTTFGVIMLVRDEADFVGPNVRFHHQQGFDRFAIMVNAATDGTREKLEGLAESLPITIVDQPDLSFRQIEWATQLARTLAVDGVEWGIRIDADEFITLREGELRETIAELDHPILCRRGNLLPLASVCQEPTYHPLKDSYLRVARPLGPYPFGASETSRPFPVALRSLPGKVLFPLKGLVQVGAGNHRVDHQKPTQTCHALLIRHFPVRRFDQFLRRLDLGKRGSSSIRLRAIRRSIFVAGCDCAKVASLRATTKPSPDAIVQSYLQRGIPVEDFFGKDLN